MQSLNRNPIIRSASTQHGAYPTLLQENNPPLRRVSQNNAVIVDELDNLTVDTADQAARMSYPSENSNHWIFSFIFIFVKDNFAENGFEQLQSPATLIALKKYLSENLDPKAAELALKIKKCLRNGLNQRLKLYMCIKKKKNMSFSGM